MSIIVNGVELTEVIYAGVNLDTVKVKKGTAEAVTVFEKITQLATPQNVTANGTVVSWDEVENATSYEVLADGTSIGTVDATPTPTLISFTINGTTYQAESGMTWQQWVDSSYNTAKYYIDSFDCVVQGPGGAIVTTDSAFNNSVSSTDIITATAYYYGQPN